MELGWTKIYTSADFFKNEIVRQVLQEHDIEAVVIDKRGFPYNFGQTEVYVHQDNFSSATELIIQNDL